MIRPTVRDRDADADHVADLARLTAAADALWQSTTDAVAVTIVGTGGDVGAVEVITDRDVMVPATYYASDGRTGDGWACWRETVDGSFRPDDDLVGYGRTPLAARCDLRDRAVRRLAIGERGTA